MRLDSYLYEKGYYSSRNKAAEACGRGEVKVDGTVRKKPSFAVSDGCVIETTGVRYVSLGAYKLMKALDDFGCDVEGKIFADIGASTGGFTQSLIIRGAKKVYCVDVGEGLLDKTISCDERVVVMDNTNARYLKREDFSDDLDGVVIDCSFISLKTVLPVVMGLTGEDGFAIALIKPQFECGKDYLGKSGVLHDKRRVLTVLKDIYDFCVASGFIVKGLTYAPVSDKRNIEFLILLDKKGESLSPEVLSNVLESAWQQR